jgi:beta-galactosidase
MRLKNIISFSLCTLDCVMRSAQLITQNEWENPKITDTGKEAPKAFYIPLANLKVTNESSSRVVSLNKNWKFHYIDKPAERPLDFYKTTFNDKMWSNITNSK